MENIVEIKVPSLGESVTEATVAKWYKKSGDEVKNGEVLVELETDKVTLEVAAPANGQLSEIVTQTGSSVSIGTILGYVKVQEQGHQPQAVPTSSKQAEQGQSNSTKQDLLSNSKLNNPVPDNIDPEQNKTREELESNTLKHIPSPSAHRIIEENNLDLDHIKGTGKDGRITKGDAVLAIAKQKARLEAEEDSTPQTTLTSHLGVNNLTQTISSPYQELETRVKMTRLRQTIAQRLKNSQNTAAILTTFNEIDMFEVIRLRQVHQDSFQKKHGVKLGFMSFFVKATINALKTFPVINASIEGDEIIYRSYYNIGVAVGTEKGLVVPVLKNTENMNFAEIELQVANFGNRAKENNLTLADMSGGTFSITNGGIYGSMLSTPIINPPQSAILGMHNIVQRPVVLANNEIAARPIMYIALSYDHRLIDGREAVQFLARIKEQIEKPEKMLLEI